MQQVPTMLQALTLRAALPAMVWAWPLDRVLRALTPERRTAPAARESLAAIGEVTELVTRRLRPTRTACLGRALMRYAMLQRAGHDAGFVIGVRPGSREGFEAHAWVTLEGQPWLERDTVDYRPTFEWPTKSASAATFHSFR